MPEYKIINKNNVLYGPPLKEKSPEGGVGWFISRQCEKYTEQLMQSCPYENRSITFEDFKTQSFNLAGNLQQLFKVSKGDVIMNCMKNSLENGLPIVSAFHIGAIASTLDPTLSIRDCKHLVNLIKPKVILVDEESLSLIEKTLENLDHKPVLIVNGNSTHRYPKLSNLIKRNIIKEEIIFEPVFIQDEGTPAVILFSSGTTGLPKGICLSHKAVYFNGYLFLDFLNNPKCLLHFGTLYWISGLSLLLTQFMNGCKRIALRHWDPEFNCQIINNYQVNAAFVVTSSMHGLLDMKQYTTMYDISSLKTILIGGSTIYKEVMIRLHAAFPDIMFAPGYGMSELGPISGYLTGFREKAFEKPAASGRVGIGTILKVKDLETGKILGSNQKGELYIKTEQILTGYWKNEKETPFDEEGFVKTGDVGHFDDKYFIYVYDRIKDMFKYKWWQIVPASIEHVLKEHPNVYEAVVFGIKHEVDGFWPSAAVTLKNPKGSSTEELVDFVAERVADIQRLRGGLVIVEKIERTPTGKIQRKRVQEEVIKYVKKYSDSRESLNT